MPRIFFEATGHGLGEEFSGMILFICMEPGNRGWWTAAKGSVRPLFSKTNINRIDDRLEPYMKAGQYGTGVIHYLDDIDTLYSRGSMPRPMIETIFLFLPGLAAAIIAGLLVSSKMKDDMKTVRVAVNANASLVQDSLQLRRVEDRFLYSTVTRTERSSSNDGGGSSDYSSNYSSSSGSSWSGGGRSF